MLESSKYVPNRDEYLLQICAAKKVLHIGACDAPFTSERLAKGALLHTKLEKVAKELVGIDIDAKAIEIMNSNGYKNILLFDMNNLETLDFAPDVVIFGETIEHLLNLQVAFENLKKVMRKDTTLVITTPNALNVANFINALSMKETCHPDHKLYFTPQTLINCVEANGLSVKKVTFTSLDSYLDVSRDGWLKTWIKKYIIRQFIKRFFFLSGNIVLECSLSTMENS